MQAKLWSGFAEVCGFKSKIEALIADEKVSGFAEVCGFKSSNSDADLIDK